MDKTTFFYHFAFPGFPFILFSFFSGLNNYSKLIFWFLQERHDEVKTDCTHAVQLNPKYVKALQRRAKACELTNQLQQSLEDLSTVLMLEGFQNEGALISADRVLNELGM